MSPEAGNADQSRHEWPMQGRDYFVRISSAAPIPAPLDVRLVHRAGLARSPSLRHMPARGPRGRARQLRARRDHRELPRRSLRSGASRLRNRTRSSPSTSDEKMILVGGTEICRREQEIRLHPAELILQREGRMAMHCPANKPRATGGRGDLFGLSGTGKTTLSATFPTHLLGDEEHALVRARVSSTSRDRLLRQDDQPLARRRSPERSTPTASCQPVIENMVFDPRPRSSDFETTACTPTCAAPTRCTKSQRQRKRLAGTEEHRSCSLRRLRRGCRPFARRRRRRRCITFRSRLHVEGRGTERG